jgi:8-oxo-dGTP pyrophosphatase MutT (NUDIX family)
MSLEDICLKLRFKLKSYECFKLEQYFWKAAVAIILHPSKMGFEALYVKRAYNPSDPWSGQIAFPGGRFREGDEDIVETAIREVYEETGIKLSRMDILGLMEAFHPINEPRLEVIPVVALIRSKPNVKLSGELQEYFWAPVNRLSKGNAEVKHSDGRMRFVEAYMYDGYVIWGLTARITESLIRILQSL